MHIDTHSTQNYELATIHNESKDRAYFEQKKPEIASLYHELIATGVDNITVEHIIHVVFGKKYVAEFGNPDVQEQVQEITEKYWDQYPQYTKNISLDQIPPEIITALQKQTNDLENPGLEQFLHKIQLIVEQFGAQSFIARFQNGYNAVYVINPRQAKRILIQHADLLKTMNISLEGSAQEIITQMQDVAFQDYYETHGETVQRLFGYLMGASQEGVDQFFINYENRLPEFHMYEFSEQDGFTLPFGLVDNKKYHKESFFLQSVIDEIKKETV